MPLITPIQPSFAGGEYSPAIYPRVDLEKYKSGLRTAYNFIVHPQGGASNRCGFEYIASTKYSNSMSVAQEFIFSQDQAYALEFGHLYVRFFTDGAQLTSGGTAYEVATPYTESSLSQLRFESSADVIFITHPDFQQRTLTRFGGTNWVLDTIDYEDGPFMPENIDEGTSLSVAAVTGTTTLSISSTTTLDSTYGLLLHFDGANGSTTFDDETGKVVTAFGDAQISTAQSVFGGSSGYFDGVGDYLTIPDSSSWTFAANPFTIGVRIRFDTIAHGHPIVGQFVDANNFWIFYWQIDNALKFVNMVAGVQTTNVSGTWTPTANTWYELELVRTANNLQFRVDGVQKGANVAFATNMANLAAVLTIGKDASGFIFPTDLYTGYMDELRILPATAAHTTNYTSPTSAFNPFTTVSSSAFVFSPYHVGALFKLKHYVGNQAVTQAFASSTTSTSIKCFTTWRLITHGTWTGTIKIQKSTDSGTTWTDLRLFSSVNDFNANTSGTEDIETNPVPFLIRMNMSTYSSGTCNADLTSDPFYQEGIVQVASFTSTTSVQVSVLSEVGAITATTSWSEGSWSDYRGWPAVSRFYQDRLVYASTYSEPQTLWMTRTGNYYSFFRHSTLLDTDGITVSLPSRQLNAINGLVAFKKLLAFTSSSVWSIGPISGSALTPTTVNQDIEEYSGSANIAPVVLGTEALFSDSGEEVVRNIGFQLANDGFIGSETNILAKHFFEGYTIIKMAYQRKPNSTIWCLRSDGLLLALTYLKEQEVVAWSRHETDGEIKSICVIPGDNSDELWAIVERDNGMFMERMQGRKQHDLTGHVFLDSYTTALSNTAVISHLNHLANEVVGIVADDAYLGTYSVSASGTLALTTTYATSYIGLPYNSDFETLNIEVPLKNGTLQGAMIKIGNVTFRLINTRGGYVGPNSRTLHEAFTYAVLNSANYQQNGVALGATENASIDVRVPLGSGYEQGGRIFYRQQQPYPVTIGAVVPEFEFGAKNSG